MSNQLFPTPVIQKFLLDLKYDGPSFDGVMEIGALGREILAIEFCVNHITKVLKKHERIENEISYEILVEAFQNNCFRKRVKLANDLLKEYKPLIETGAIVCTAFWAIFLFINQNDEEKIREILKNDMSFVQTVKDEVQQELMKDPDFLKQLAKLVIPLKPDDKLYLTSPSPEHSRMCIDYQQSRKIISIANENEEIIFEKRQILKGRISSISVDADKNKMKFKIRGKGGEIVASLEEGLEPDNYLNFLKRSENKWAEIDSLATYKNNEIDHIHIFSIKEIPAPDTETEDLFANVEDDNS